jgi:hypothetical protein
MPGFSFAYLSQGRLFVIPSDGGPAQNIQSEFGLRIDERSQEIARKRAWKTDDSNPFSGRMLWGKQASVENERIALVAVAFDGPRQRLFYFLETSVICALLRYDLGEREELRLFHREHMRAADLDVDASGELLAFSLRHPNHTANIATVGTDGRDLQQLTDGDSVDEAPSFVPSEGGRALVFQSAGVARGVDGHFAGLSPASVQRLDLESGDIVTLAESDEFDFLTPRCDRDGNLYFIRRPYEPPGGVFSLRRLASDIVLFPFRLGRAFIAFLNVFSLVFSRKPLMTAGGPQQEGPDAQAMRLRGRYIDVRQALRKAGRDADTAGLVPSNWELVKRTPGGDEKILARQVAGFNFGADGQIMFTHGRAIYNLSENGKSVLLAKGLAVEAFATGDLTPSLVDA